MSEVLKSYLLIGLGSALGGMGRFWLSGVIAQKFGETFPWGTILVNVSGSLLIGLIAGLNIPDGRILMQPIHRQFLMIGICGGYTTFSSFSLQTLELLRRNQWLYASGNILVSIAFCLIAVWLGYVLGQFINR